MSRGRSLAEKSGSLEHSLSDDLDHLVVDNPRFKIAGSTEVKVIPPPLPPTCAAPLLQGTGLGCFTHLSLSGLLVHYT